MRREALLFANDGSGRVQILWLNEAPCSCCQQEAKRQTGDECITIDGRARAAESALHTTLGQRLFSEF